MTAIATGPTLSQQLYMRLFDRLNVNDDDALSFDEVGAADAQSIDSARLFKTLDADADGRVIRAEMTPSNAFGADTLGSLIQAQSQDEPASSATAAIADLFDRADLDGDGALNADEMQAEADLRRAASLDAGYMAGSIFVSQDRNDDRLLTQDEIRAAQPLRSLQLPLSAVRFFDELPKEDQQRLQAMRERAGLPPLQPLTEEGKAAKRADWAADRAERASGPEGTTTFLSREIDDLRAKASAAYAKEDLSDSLSQRLLQDILGESWKTETSA